MLKVVLHNFESFLSLFVQCLIIWQTVPYIAVLIGALCGVNVFLLLGSGIVLAGLIGIFTGSFDFLGFIDAVSSGINGMQELSILVLIVGGVVGLIKFNGGIEFILNFITSKIKTKNYRRLWTIRVFFFVWKSKKRKIRMRHLPYGGYLKMCSFFYYFLYI